MNAEIIAVGSELLTPSRLDTNSLYLTSQLNMLGVELISKCIVGDDRTRLIETIRTAVSRSDIIILTGGLGPTEDDLTRDAVAAALGRTLTFSQEICDSIDARFRRMGRKMAEINKRQAYLVSGAEILDNPNGTAPGHWLTEGRAVLMLLPGPPNEMKPMFVNLCQPRLEKLLPPLVIATRFYRVGGMPESDVDQLVAPVYTRYPDVATTILAAPGDIQLHLRARGATLEEAEARVSEVAPQIEALLGDRIYSLNGDPLEKVVGDRLRELGATLAVAESCTGGLIAERISSVPGSSAYFRGGFVTYTNATKDALLGVPADLLRDFTAVSEPVARAMAEGARARCLSDYAISVTGYAGPDGGTEQEPVGTVYIGLATPSTTSVRRVRFIGERARVRTLASQTALDLLRRALAAPQPLIE
ncbi:MAG: competence/damage-inducible protein A [Acidobacteria bacterium]|nr:competence/damage-inducible protein A [Acidobacteriota bacterium]